MCDAGHANQNWRSRSPKGLLKRKRAHLAHRLPRKGEYQDLVFADLPPNDSDCIVVQRHRNCLAGFRLISVNPRHVPLHIDL